MGLRFTETDKWNDEWFTGLPPTQKLVFNFLCDKCDNAGFFEINPRVHAFMIGISTSEYEGALKGLIRGLVGAVDGRKFWVKNFLHHQKNLPLNPANNAHKQIIKLIQEQQENFDFDFAEYLGAPEPLLRGPGIGIVKVKVEEEGGVGETKSSKLPQQFRTRIGMDILSELSPSEYIQKHHALYYINMIMGRVKKENIPALHADFDTNIGTQFTNEKHFTNAFRQCVIKQQQLNGNSNGPRKLQSVESGQPKNFNDGHTRGT